LAAIDPTLVALWDNGRAACKPLRSVSSFPTADLAAISRAELAAVRVRRRKFHCRRECAALNFVAVIVT
jgi:hypothetical protein